MGMLCAHEFEVVRRKIDDQHVAARSQRAACAGDGPARIVEIVEDLVEDDDVGRPHPAIDIGNIAQPHMGMGDVGRRELGPGHRDHLAA
jgi:hypothetical protein